MIVSVCKPIEKRIEKFSADDFTIRSHHLLDIFGVYGNGIRCQSHEYGHALHLDAEEVLRDPGCEIDLVIGSDDF
jgi:hypothetical protein